MYQSIGCLTQINDYIKGWINISFSYQMLKRQIYNAFPNSDTSSFEDW